MHERVYEAFDRRAMMALRGIAAVVKKTKNFGAVKTP